MSVIGKLFFVILLILNSFFGKGKGLTTFLGDFGDSGDKETLTGLLSYSFF